MLISVKAFGGMVPRIGARLLNPNQAQVSSNAKFWSGELRPLYEDLAIKELDTPVSGQYKTLYRYDHTVYGPRWLAQEEDINFVKGPVFADEYNRVYCTGLDVPRAFDSTMLADTTTQVTTSNTIPLAVPKPSAFATMAVNGTSTGDDTARAYVYTYIREWDDTKFDESMPSDAAQTAAGDVTVTVGTGQTVTLSGIILPTSRDDITRVAVYRTATGTSETSYQLVIDINIADAIAGTVPNVTHASGELTFLDDVLTEDLGTGLVSLDWDAPLDTLTGLISLGNGVLAGFAGNDVYFSEPYQPHAWPIKYRKTIDFNVVGLGHYGDTVVVLTENYPIIINATDPEAAVAVGISEIAPCTAAKSIVNSGDACYYASTNGYIRISADGLTLVTQALYSRDEWTVLNPSTFESALYDGKVFISYTTDEDIRKAIVIDLAEGNAGVSRLTGIFEAFYVEPEFNRLYYVYKPSGYAHYIWEWEGNRLVHKKMIWKTKKFVSPQGPLNFAAARVRAQYPPTATQEELDAIAAEQAALFSSESLGGELNGAPVNTLTLNGDYLTNLLSTYQFNNDVTFKLFVDDVLVFTKVLTNDKPFRLPSGLVGTVFEITVEGQVDIYHIDMATSMNELQ